MKSVTCPNCGNEIDIPWWLPRIVTCKECHEELLVAYDEDPDADKRNVFAKLKVNLNNFETAHPKVATGVKVTFGTLIAGGILYILRPKETDTIVSPSVETPDESPERADDSSLTESASRNDTMSAQALSESEESVSVHREYSPRNPDNYDIIEKFIDAGLVRLPVGRHASQEKIDEYKEKNDSDLPPGMTTRREHTQRYQVKKD